MGAVGPGSVYKLCTLSRCSKLAPLLSKQRNPKLIKPSLLGALQPMKLSIVFPFFSVQPQALKGLVQAQVTAISGASAPQTSFFHSTATGRCGRRLARWSLHRLCFPFWLLHFGAIVLPFDFGFLCLSGLDEIQVCLFKVFQGAL